MSQFVEVKISRSSIREVQLINAGGWSPNLGKGKANYRTRAQNRALNLQQRKAQKRQLQESRRGTH